MPLSRNSGGPTPKASNKKSSPDPRRLRMDFKKAFSDIRDMYSQTDEGNVNILLMGPHGEGKTKGMEKAPGPVLIHSFDPGGTDSIETPQIESGRVMVDRRFENESVASPQAWRLWEQEFTKLEQAGAFEHIGTYVIDSLTTWQTSLMNAILSARGRKPPGRSYDLSKDPDIVPEQGDYNVHQKTLHDALKRCCNLPCHFVLIAHTNVWQHDLTKKVYVTPYMDGKKFSQMLPTLFNEVWFTSVKGAGPSAQYFYNPFPSGGEKARTRIGTGIFKKNEPQDLRDMLKRAGKRWEDRSIPDPDSPEEDQD